MEAAAEQVEDQFGPIDVWVNAVSTTVFSPTAEIQRAVCRRRPCGAKAAIRGFTDALRCELMYDGSGVKVTTAKTRQFSWVLTRLPRHPRPVAPVYQPEVAAEGTLYAADHPEPSRQRCVAGSLRAEAWRRR